MVKFCITHPVYILAKYYICVPDRGSKAAIVCYSVNDAESWERLQFWVSELRKMEEGCRVYICATKTDLLRGDNRNRVVDYHTTTDYCDEFGTELFETSSRQGTNISEMFLKVASDYLENEDVTDFVAHEEFTLNKSEKKSCCGGRT